MHETKIARVREHLLQLESVLIAASGGVDSCLLLAIAAETPMVNVHMATVESPAHPAWELERCTQLSLQYGIQHHLVKVDELAHPLIRNNGPDRCFHCKYQRYQLLLDLCRSIGLLHVLDGSNADDLKDNRPGTAAIRELGIQMPLADADFTKKEIREAAREKGLSMWNAPSSACLYTRIPMGESLDYYRIQRVGAAEKILIDAGYLMVRVRDHGVMARIELPLDEIFRFLTDPDKERIIKEIKGTGYRFIAVDAEGYRKGNMSL
ncbi:ATP-dependent sacrificial sulfur transferase LarE [bacterium]|nr:ATP-dependent sacrificial sulfur transferase LarE [candidate division CSSED10-310 bacterium]